MAGEDQAKKCGSGQYSPEEIVNGSVFHLLVICEIAESEANLYKNHKIGKVEENSALIFFFCRGVGGADLLFERVEFFEFFFEFIRLSFGFLGIQNFFCLPLDGLT